MSKSLRLTIWIAVFVISVFSLIYISSLFGRNAGCSVIDGREVCPLANPVYSTPIELKETFATTVPLMFLVLSIVFIVVTAKEKTK